MVDGINNLSNAELAKLALAKKGITTSSDQKPIWLTQDGSLWNAPKPQIETQPKNIDELTSLDASKMTTKKECEKALEDINSFTQSNPILKSMFKSKVEEITNKKNELSFQESQQNLKNIAEGNSTQDTNSSGQTNPSQSEGTTIDANNISASEGRAMAANLDSQRQDLESQTKAVEQDGKTAESYSKDAQKKQKTLIKDQKSLEKQYKKESQSIQKNQEQITQLTDSLNTENDEVNALQSELEGLLAANSTGVGVNSAFSLSLAGTEEYQQDMQAQQDDPNAARIAELQGQISTKSASMQKTGTKINKLQTSTNKQIKTMHKVSTKYMAGVQNIQAGLETNKKASDDILEIANKAEEISTTIATAGTSVKYAGAALIALGSSTSWCFGAGAALIAAGQVMQKVGTVAETIGQYGQLAANVTKTACYAAQGDIAGALTSAGAAIMSGTSAVKGSQEWGNTFAEIDQKATEATQKLAAGVAARETVSQMAESGSLGNLTKKQATKLAKAGAMEQLKDQSADAINASFKDGIGNAAQKASSGASTAVTTAVAATENMSKEAIKEGLRIGTITVSENSSTIIKEAAEELKKEGSNKLKSFDTWNKIGSSFQAAGKKMQSMVANNNSDSNSQYKGGYAPHYLTNPTKGYAMFAETQDKLQRRSYARFAA